MGVTMCVLSVFVPGIRFFEAFNRSIRLIVGQWDPLAEGLFVFFFSLFSYHGPLFMVFEMQSSKSSMLVIALSAAELVVFLVGIGFRLGCLMQVNSKFDADDD